jgi:hypothetical protein
MDPTATYLAMFNAMSDKKFGEAREHAENLQNWLSLDGFYPPSYTKVEVDAYLANVLRRTVGYK